MPEAAPDPLDGFADRAARRSPGGELFFDSATAQEILGALAHQDVGILGIEGFEWDGRQLQVRMDLIFDAGWPESYPNWGDFVQRSHTIASAVIAEARSRDPLIWSLVTMSHPA